MAEETEEEEYNFGFDFGGGESEELTAEDFGEEFAGFDLVFADEEESQYVKPKLRAMHSSCIRYENAERLAAEHPIGKGDRYDCFVSGSFIFGDYIEAYFVKHNIRARKLTISTLSLSQDNVDSLANLLHGGYVDEINMIVSVYFFSHERRKLIPYIYQELDIDGRFQMAVAGVHTKTCQFDCEDGRKIVMHGSANLRSSANVEQFTIEENEELYQFYDDFFQNVLDEYGTICKPIRDKRLWDVATKKRFND